MTNEMVIKLLKKLPWVLLGVAITLTSLLGHFFYTKTQALYMMAAEIDEIRNNQEVMLQGLNFVLPEDKQIMRR